MLKEERVLCSTIEFTHFDRAGVGKYIIAYGTVCKLKFLTGALHIAQNVELFERMVRIILYCERHNLAKRERSSLVGMAMRMDCVLFRASEKEWHAAIC